MYDMGRELVLVLTQSLCSVVTLWGRGFTASALAAGAEGVRAKPTLKWEKSKFRFQQTAEQLNIRLCVHFMQFFVSILNFSEQLTIKLLSFPAVRYK